MPQRMEAKDDVGLRILLSVGLGTFMSALDASVVNTVLPVMRASFGASVETIQWVVSIYLLLMGGLLLTFGRLGDIGGHRRVYLLGFGVFLPASILCGLSPSERILVLARSFQGVGAAMLVSNSPVILIGSVHPSRIGRALGLQAAMTAVGLALGPSFGGWLTDRFGWRAIFFINVPFGAAAFLLGARHIPETKRADRAGGKFDIPGAALFLGAFLSLLVALNRGNVSGWTSGETAATFACGIALGALFLRRESRAANPMLDLSLFRIRLFSCAVGSALVNYVCVAALIFLTPFYLIQGLGMQASKAGLVMTAQSLTMVAIAPFSGRLSDRVGSRIPATAGMAVQACGFFLLSRLDAGSSLAAAVLGMAVAGAGTAIFVTPNNSAMLGAAPAGRKGIASGILATARLMGMATGVGIAGAVLAGIAGDPSAWGKASGAVIRAVQIGFLSAGILASAGTLLTASRGNAGGGGAEKGT